MSDELPITREAVKQITESRRKVLLVEDNPGDAVLTVKLLEGFQCDVVHVVSGEEALKRIDGGDVFSLAVIDLALPGMNGQELLEELRKRRPNLSVAVLTGHPDAESVVKACAMCLVAVTTKPLQSSVVAKILESVNLLSLNVPKIS